MTRDEAIAQAPNGRKTYWLTLVVGAGIGLAVSCDLFNRGTSLLSRVTDLPVAAIFLLVALQSAERLFRPERAALRTAAFTDKQRNVLNTAEWVGLVAAVLLYLFAVVARHGGWISRAKAQDLESLPWMLLFFRAFLRDLLGQPSAPVRPRPMPWTQLSPIHSDRWGQR